MREYRYCRDCKMFFDKNDTSERREYHTEIADHGFTPYEVFPACPHCGSDNIDDAEICPVCGTPHESLLNGLCLKCDSRVYETASWLLDQFVEYFTGDDLKEALYAIEDTLSEAIPKAIERALT